MAKQRNGPVIDEEFMKEMISQGIPIKRNQASTENVIKESTLKKKEKTQSVSTETKKEDKIIKTNKLTNLNNSINDFIKSHG